jgi:hypothetical protein
MPPCTAEFLSGKHIWLCIFGGCTSFPSVLLLLKVVTDKAPLKPRSYKGTRKPQQNLAQTTDKSAEMHLELCGISGLSRSSLEV